MRQLAMQSGYSVSTIRRVISYWLQHPPRVQTSLSKPRYLIFDGTFLERRRGIFAVMDAERFSVVYNTHNVSEGPLETQRICTALAQRAAQPQSATVDGNPHLIKTLKLTWPEIIIQRCLVHVQRQGLRWCRRFPKRTDAKRLRELFLRVMAIHSPADRNRFVTNLNAWEQRYGRHIADSPEHGWVFSDLKRARSMLLAALPDMFHFLNDNHIPTSTNALEGYFARLKQRYRQHRGLAAKHRESYFNWYFHLCPR